MNKKFTLIVLSCVIVISFACLTPIPTPPTQTIPTSPTTDEIATLVASTLTALVSPQPGLTDLPPTDTLTPSCTPVHPGAQILSLPAGITAGQDTTVTFYDLQGAMLASRTLPGISWMAQGQFQPAGSLSMGANNLPLIYYSLQNNGTLKSNVNNVTTDLALMPNLTAMIGAEGNSFLSFVTLDMMSDSINRVYAGNLADLPGMPPRMTWTPPANASYGNAIWPLAVHYEAGQARGLWFTYSMYGIGDINFPPYRGLSYLDLSNNQVTEFINSSLALGGISPDQIFIAYNPASGGSPWITGGFSIRNLVTCQETYIPLDPGSNLGAGYVVFSPDNQFVAWMEASGPSNMEAEFRLRVARMDGTSVFNAPAANLSGFLGGEAVSSPRPVGWASNHLLLLEIYSTTLNSSVLVIWAPDPAQPLDPALGANQSAPIGDGAFLGFVYP